MDTVKVHEAKTHLSRLLVRVAAGEEIIISRADKPIARLVPFRSRPARRVLGEERGRIGVAEDFDDLPKEILAEFES